MPHPARPTGLVSAEDISPALLNALCDIAREMRAHPDAVDDLLVGRRVALCFFEPSTRTRLSFALACEHVGARWMDVGDSSSAAKGESLTETCHTLGALGFDALVLRHPAEGAALIARDAGMPTINAGDGVAEHPTQALADVLALEDAVGDIAGMKIAFVGDVLRSRVARSSRHVLALRGAEIRIAGPTSMVAAVEDPGGVMTTREEACAWADAVYVLRPQRERGALDGIRESDYIRDWRIGDTHLRGDQWLMHAGPLLPGLDLASSLVADPRLLARQQVQWGPWARAATLGWLLANV